jgi:hypothetical protein
MDNPPNFFIPSVKKLQPETIYQKLKKYAVSSSKMHISDRRIFRLELEHNGTLKGIKSDIEVGGTIGEYDKTQVITIFESESWYIVFIKRKGKKLGIPLYIDGEDVTEVIEFSP